MATDPLNSVPEAPQKAADARTWQQVRWQDVVQKQRSVADFLEDEGYDALLLETQENFAWFTSGADNTPGMPGPGSAALFVTPESRSIVADNVEAVRLFEEEVGGLGFQLKQSPWHEQPRRMIQDLCQRRKVASDTGVCGTSNEAEKLRRLRMVLSNLECDRYRELGRDVSHALEATCRALLRGETEAEVAGQVAHRLIKRKIVPVLLMVAADERSAQFRRPVFKDNPIHHRCMVAVAGRRYGLCAAASRTVCFGRPPDEFVQNHQMACMLDATYIFFSTPGESATEVFRRAKRIYEKFRCPHEWILCSQGGVVGFSPNELSLQPESDFRFRANMAMSWHPTVGAARSQDTVLIDEDGFEVLTPQGQWPTVTVNIKGCNVDRPGLLIR